MRQSATKTVPGSASENHKGQDLVQGAVSAQVLRSVAELTALEDQWYALLESHPAHTIFSTPAWLIPIAQEYQQRLKILTIAVYQGGCLIGLAPLVILRKPWGHKVLRFLGMGPPRSWHSWSMSPCRFSWSDYQDIIAAEDKEQRVVEAILGKLQELSGQWDVMELTEMVETSPVLRVLLEEAAKRGWITLVHKMGASYIRRLPCTWEEFLKSLSSNFRQEMERKARKAVREVQLGFQVVSGDDHVDEVMDQLIRLHTLQRNAQGLSGIFAREGIARFVKAASLRMAKRGLLQLALLIGPSGPVGVALNFRYRGEVYYYHSGFDPSLSKYSLGTLLIRYAILKAIEAGDHTFNFLRGHEDYKFRYGVEPVRHLGLMVWRSKPPFLAYRAVRKLDKEYKRLARCRVL